MRIVFITPASDFRRSHLYRLGSMSYGHSNAITGPLILGSLLKSAGHDVSVYEELYQDINFSKLTETDVFCIYTMTPNADRAYFIADKLRVDTHARIIIGGMHASFVPEEAAIHADQVVTGEAETVILDIIEGRITDQLVHAPHLKNLDDAPYPDYTLLKTQCTCANVMTTRGCPFSCSFCTTSRMYHPYRRRSIESVIDELKVYKKQGFHYMNFEDDNFTADKERAKEICRRMIAEKLIFKETFFFGRTDIAQDEELLKLLSSAHLNRVLIGMESINQESLDMIDKRQSVADIHQCGETLSHYNIRLIVSLILGIDGDSLADIQHAVDYAIKINAYQLQPAILTPYPGTPIYQQLKEENRLINCDWEYFDMMNVTFFPKKMTPYALQKQFYLANLKFYSISSLFSNYKRFDLNWVMRRLAMSIVIRACALFMLFTANFLRNTHVYRLKHL
ncbi:MAG: B12-binding domain-containing radical SAM protein [Clostridiales bacterium]|nr:B12-binding domain-containing radical SAM protein [Clostridiales bacterium]